MRALYDGVDVWISRLPEPAPAPHAHASRCRPRLGRGNEGGKLYLSHLNNSMDYRTLVTELPDWAAPAHDGLEIEL